MPISDMDIPEAKKLFDLNVWSYLEMTQAFIPLLMKSKGMIVNQTSIAGATPIPFQSAYNASKAAMAMFSEIMSLELAPFGIKVVELKTGGVASTIYAKNYANREEQRLPEGSIYESVREVVERSMSNEELEKGVMDQKAWAEATVRDLLREKPKPVIWRGANAALVRFSTVMPYGWFHGMVKKMFALDVVERMIAGK